MTIGKFSLLPPLTEIIGVVDTTTIEYGFEFDVVKSEASGAADPSSFQYKLLMSESMDLMAEDTVELVNSEQTHSDVSQREVSGRHSPENVLVLIFCHCNLFLI